MLNNTFVMKSVATGKRSMSLSFISKCQFKHFLRYLNFLGIAKIVIEPTMPSILN